MILVHQTCTHMIASRATSLLPPTSPAPSSENLGPDVQEALEIPRIEVVYPEWVYECQRMGRRLPESDFRFQSIPRGMSLNSFSEIGWIFYTDIENACRLFDIFLFELIFINAIADIELYATKNV